MNWININVAVLDSEEFLGAEPTQRATWLCLLRYCAGQENGGCIAGAREWKDRKWQQVVRVTGKEVADACDLWSWDGDDLIVFAYPKDKEEEVKQKREAGRRGGQARTQAKAEAARKNGASKGQAESEADTQAELPTEPKQNPSNDPTERNRKGREGNGIEEEEQNHPLPPSWTEVKTFAESAPVIISPECTAAFFDEMESVQWTYRGQPCIERNAWHARFRRFSTNWNQNEQGRGNR